jgi:primosomal protein N' (replication factor Y)
MPNRVDRTPLPDIAIVDMVAERKTRYAQLRAVLPEDQRYKLNEFKSSPVSSLLQAKIEDRLAKREGIILLQNRRGFAPFVECPDCGFTERCDTCSITLTYHLARKHLRCHYCGRIKQPHTTCPQCRGPHIELLGVGTQKVEQELATMFPNARVLRMDLDTTTRKGAHDRLLRKFGNREADILLGTQMVAKGLDFPHVTLVGVISADTQMLLPDFRASERTFQLLTQVAGRAGRSSLHGEVIIQTHQRDHYTLRHVMDHDIRKFYEDELEERRGLDYPPFARIALVETRGENELVVQKHSEKFAALLQHATDRVTILGPSPAVITRIRGHYRWHIIAKSPKSADPSGARLRAALREAWSAYTPSSAKTVKLTIDMDPAGLM